MTLQGSLCILKDFLAKLLLFQETPIALPPLPVTDVEKVDYISRLPDCVLAYIQSMLPMRDMMNTSVLSKRWCNLWHLRRDLNFDVCNVFGNKEKVLEHFECYVTMVEFVKRIDPFFKKFRGEKIDSFTVEFHLDSRKSNNIDQWVKFAISKGVGRIALLSRRTGERVTCYEFPFGLSFKCNNSTLKHIHLKFCLVRNPTNFAIVTFANLRSLVLIDSEVADEIFLGTLLSNCLQLEELSLIECQLNSSTLQVESSSLCHFKLANCRGRDYDDNCIYIGLTSLNCLKLTSLHVDNLSTSSINAPMLKSIDHVHILLVETLHHAFANFATFAKLEILNLYFNCFKISTPVLQGIQTLKNLRQFNLSIDAYHMRNIGTSWILPMLQAFPLLQKLTIMIRHGYLSYYDTDQIDIQDLMSFSHDEIKVIELGGCVGNWYEIELTLNALKYIHKLERIVLSPDWKGNRYNEEWKCDPIWYENGRERVLKKLQDEGIELDKLVLI